VRPGEVYQGDAEGVFDLPKVLANMLCGTAGWTKHGRSRPKAVLSPQGPPESPKTPEPTPAPPEKPQADTDLPPASPEPEEEEPEEELEEEEEVPGYDEWSSSDLAAEVKVRSLKLSGRSKAVMAAALEADDEAEDVGPPSETDSDEDQ